MNIYEYKHRCPICQADWTERRLKPFKLCHELKTCPDCLRGYSLTQVKEFIGVDTPESCANCTHFSAKGQGSHAWGECGLGRKLPNEYEYTLSYAIDHVTGCDTRPEEHEDYGKDVYGLVHGQCSCSSFEQG